MSGPWATPDIFRHQHMVDQLWFGSPAKLVCNCGWVIDVIGTFYPGDIVMKVRPKTVKAQPIATLLTECTVIWNRDPASPHNYGRQFDVIQYDDLTEPASPLPEPE